MKQCCKIDQNVQKFKKKIIKKIPSGKRKIKCLKIEREKKIFFNIF